MLVRAVTSVARQTYSRIETIVVDDNSNYDVEARIRTEFGLDRCRVVTNTRSPGAAGARNAGFYESRGAFIGFLDDDDEWLPDKISRQVEAFQSAIDEIGIVTASYFVVQNTTRTIRLRNLEGHVFQLLCKEQVAGNTSIPLIRREVFEAVGMFDEQLTAAQDTDLWLRIAKHYGFATVHEPLALIHWQGSDRITKNLQNQIQGVYRFLRKHWADLPGSRKYRLVKAMARLSLALSMQKLRR
jgi:O-antigen biosynthesis protein